MEMMALKEEVNTDRCLETGGPAHHAGPCGGHQDQYGGRGGRKSLAGAFMVFCGKEWARQGEQLRVEWCGGPLAMGVVPACPVPGAGR